LFGVLNLNKPPGATSRDMVNLVQRMVRPLKCGHAGTLDPMATGVLLVCVGPATRLVSMLQEQSKTYVAEFTLGETSDTDDSTGAIVRHQPSRTPPTETEVTTALRQLTGRIRQVPPAFSAVHVQGQRAYDRARRGEDFTLPPKDVDVHEIRILRYVWPKLDLQISCGSGTYVRSIARDLGEILGCGALMSRLERTAIGSFSIAAAIAPEELRKEDLSWKLTPALQMVSHLPGYVCSETDIADLRCGRRITCHPTAWRSRENAVPPFLTALIREPDELLALAECLLAGEDCLLQPKLVFAGTGLSPPPVGS
jgi:tRNA pseudouridine55 synthase